MWLCTALGPSPTAFVASHMRTGGGLRSHKQGAGYLLLVMNLPLVALIRTVLPVYHVSLAHQES